MAFTKIVSDNLKIPGKFHGREESFKIPLKNVTLYAQSYDDNYKDY